MSDSEECAVLAPGTEHRGYRHCLGVSAGVALFSTRVLLGSLPHTVMCSSVLTLSLSCVQCCTNFLSLSLIFEC